MISFPTSRITSQQTKRMPRRQLQKLTHQLVSAEKPRKSSLTVARQAFNLLASAGSNTPEEEEARRLLNNAAAGLVIGTVGIFSMPFKIAGFLLIAPTVYKIGMGALRKTLEDRRLGSESTTTAFFILSIAGGYFIYLHIGTFFVSVINWLTIKAEDQSKRGFVNLFGQQVRTVWQQIDGVEVETPLEALQIGDIIVLRAGQMIPVDGIIVAGQATVDQQMMTGEAQPVEKEVSDKVLAATVVLAGQFTTVQKICSRKSRGKRKIEEKREVKVEQILQIA